MTSVFNPDVAVKKENVAAEQSHCKKTQKLRGAARPKRASLIAEKRKESAKQDLKLQYMAMEVSGSTGGSKSIVIEDIDSDDDCRSDAQTPLPTSHDRLSRRKRPKSAFSSSSRFPGRPT